MKHLVVGAGQVGTAVREVLDHAWEGSVDIIDTYPNPPHPSYDVLHICFPYSSVFKREVKNYETRANADLVIVHSTVPVGTCDPWEWVHSPVRGRHPDLYKALVTFTKHFGGDDAQAAANIFQACGVKVQVHPRAAETEAGKLWELVQFGLQVMVEKEIHDWCKSLGLDHDVVYRQFAETYNRGYQVLGHSQLTRPVLDHIPGKIGGHCVCECSGMLEHYLARLLTTEGWC